VRTVARKRGGETGAAATSGVLLKGFQGRWGTGRRRHHAAARGPRGVRLSGAWMGRRAPVGQHGAWPVGAGGGSACGKKIGEGEPLMGGPPGTVQVRSQTSLIQTHISNGFELYSN
jgi:hypothetical protein